jgi:hypothetical protein
MGTRIVDTIYTPFIGTLFSGTIVISGPKMTTRDGRTVASGSFTYHVDNGVIAPEIELEPTDTVQPSGVSYSVRYGPTGPASGNSWTEVWVVPTSPDPMTIAEVRVLVRPSTSVSVNLSQLARSGAITGQVPQWNGSSWAPAVVSGGSGGGGTATDIDWSQFASYVFRRAYSVFDAAQVRAMYGTPVKLIDAPGTGKYILPVFWTLSLQWGTSAYNNAVNAGVVMMYGAIHDADGEQFLANFMLLAAQHAMVQTGTGGLNYIDFASFLNKPCYISTDRSGVTGGDSALGIEVIYRVMDYIP